MSIKKSLQSSILLMAVIPVILITLIAYITITNRYAAISKKNAQHFAEDYSYFFSSHLESQMFETIALANNTVIKSCLLENVHSPEQLPAELTNDYGTIKGTLIQISNNFDQNVQYYIYNVDGYLIMASDDTTHSDWTEIMQESVSSFHQTTILPHSSFTDDTLDIIEPVIVNDTVIGLIRSNLTSEYFSNAISRTKGHFVMEENGQCLFGYEVTTQDEALYQQIHSLTDAFPSHTGEVRTSKSAKGVSGTYSNRTNYIYGYATIPKFNWIYVVRQDSSDYIKIVSTLPFIFIIILTIVIIVSIGLSKNLTDKYTEPILTLCEKMQHAADGHLGIRWDTDRKDEFGTLAVSFNQMMDIISRNYNEISEARKQLEESQTKLQHNYQQIEDLAYTDTLTGLYNRVAFYNYSNRLLSQNQSGIQQHAVIFIDLDGFKAINDTLGHDYGDLLLQSVAKQFSLLIQEDDILARNGGDEFVIFRNHFETVQELERFLASLVSIGAHPFVLEDETVHVTLSAGIALFPQNGLSLSELMKNADIAMYTSKASGKNSYTFFSSTMEDEINRRNDLIEILRHAIENKDVYLLYQPQADVTTGEIIGYEALMRLNSPLVGFVSPDEFIPIAEECGLIDELGEWALMEACNFNQRLIEAGYKPLQVSVNVSTTQLHDGTKLLQAIEALPEKTSMPLEYLEIELTESVLMENFDHNLALINRMKELNIHIALDDFGTGYSSFSYLTKIPINTLKIDKSFIAGICENQNDMYIAGTIIHLAHQLGITVIAEGVETIEQLRILQSQTCDILQGFLFSRPISEQEFIELLQINTK